VVLKVLHSEPFIRIVVASCRLSAHLRDMLQGPDQPNNTSPPTTSPLPDFAFWLSAVHTAVSEDDFWGLHFWEDIESRATDLELGVKDLIRQCCAICSPKHQRRAVTLSNLTPNNTNVAAPTSPPPPQHRHSQPLVKKQLRLHDDEQLWMTRIIEACWLALVQEAAHGRRKVGLDADAEVEAATNRGFRYGGGCRIRSLTA
jgi:hypothetical protein